MDRLEGVQRGATRTYFRMLGRRAPPPPYEVRLKALRWQSLRHRRTVARVGLLCRLLDGSMEGTPLGSYIRMGKRSGQPDPQLARTVRHTNSVLPAGLGDFLAALLSARFPLPTDRTESAALCHTFSQSLF